MIEPRRIAATVRWHAFTGVAAVTITVAAWLGASDVRVGIYEYRAIHLGITAPAWILAAAQLIELRRRAPQASNALIVAALCALVAAGAAIASELCNDELRAAAGAAYDWAGLIGGVGLLGEAGWMIAICVALVAMSHRLARGTLHLPTVRLRERALHLGTAFWLIPWSLLLAFSIAFLDHPVIGLGVIGAGVLALSVAQLALAALVAQSRELATAEARVSRE